MESYTDFAYVYDTFMDETPYEEWCTFIKESIEKYGISKPKNIEEGQETRHNPEAKHADGVEDFEQGRLLDSERNLVLDLGCGTGTLTEMMANLGYDMIGVDNSCDMLRIAKEKQEQSGLEILYLLQDMRELELYSTVGTIYSVCDSINYILEKEELSEVFALVHNYLYPGGVFIFDFNTLYKYAEVIGDTTIAENREECSFIWENFFDPEDGINEYDLTLFVKDGEHYNRFSETHYQRGYTLEEMQKLVTESGLEILLIQDADTGAPAGDVSERIHIIARKPVV